jgi:hypothetical protein
MLLLDELTAEVSDEISINVGTTEEPIPLNIQTQLPRRWKTVYLPPLDTARSETFTD